ncbi:hypothetical protein [Cytophaga aurantiaca]|uniref:hypothetical protein n=1 Tax=Cytophaga aurantiaca TaxID=29530 RepID=UPI00037E00A6|nr:hypothetical protein [Cytophaga aurantiaca]
MKKVIYSLLTVALFTFTTETNSASLSSYPSGIVATQMSTTEIFNYLNTNLGLTSTQKPVVKKAVDEAGTETTKLNADSTKSADEVKTAKTSIVNGLVKKLSSGILSDAQSKKLTGLTGQLTTMFAQLK